MKIAKLVVIIMVLFSSCDSCRTDDTNKVNKQITEEAPISSQSASNTTETDYNTVATSNNVTEPLNTNPSSTRSNTSTIREPAVVTRSNSNNLNSRNNTSESSSGTRTAPIYSGGNFADTPDEYVPSTTYTPPASTRTSNTDYNNKNSGLTSGSTSGTVYTPPPSPKPEPVALSASEKNTLKSSIKRELEGLYIQKGQFSFFDKFQNATDNACVDGDFIDDYQRSYSIYEYVVRMRNDHYRIEIQDLQFNDEGKITKMKVKEVVKLD